MKTKLIITIMVFGLQFYGCTSKVTNDKQMQTEIIPVPVEKVTLEDDFFSPMLVRNEKITLPYAFQMCEQTGRIENFTVAAGKSKKKYTGERYNDTDVYKIIEGAANTLKNHPDPKLENYLDSVINLIALAQEEDGYLFTARSASKENPAPGAGRDRWVDIWVSHELYNAGHLYEAAVAWYRATGKKNLLNVAVKNADLICDVFGWGKREAAPGHQEIEIGLIKLYEVTGNEKYLDQARFFLDVRGLPQEHIEHLPGTRFAIYNNKKYLQQHLPVLEQKEAVGHAVRATYMYTAMTKLSDKTGDDRYLNAAKGLWKDVVLKKIYLTGGIGSVGEGESFGEAYSLPNAEAYNETCAAIGNVFWNYELFLSTGNSRYVDVLERTLYNGLISGVSLDGKNFFYPNPLESSGDYTRSPWFGVACCPGNLVRFFPQIPKYIYAQTPEDIYVNLFISSVAKVKIGGNNLIIKQESGLPWSGKVKFIINSKEKNRLTFHVRVPGWLSKTPFYGDLYSFADTISYQPVIRLNDKEINCEIKDGYAIVSGIWEGESLLEVEFPLQTRIVRSNQKVKADRGRIAFERGPLVYCFEEADNGKLSGMVLNDNPNVQYEFNDTLLGGTGTLKINSQISQYTAIPYFLWSNRGKGEMEVWVKSD